MRAADPDGLDVNRRFTLLTIGVRWATVALGFAWGITSDPTDRRFLAVSAALVAWAVVMTVQPVRIEPPSPAARYGPLGALVLTVGAAMLTGGLDSTYVLTPLVPLVVAGYAWGDRLYLTLVGTAGVAVVAVLLIRDANPAAGRTGAELSLIFLLSGVLGVSLRQLVAELEDRHAATVGQVARMATANELLVALHGVAQTLPASLDLGEVVDGIRSRLRSMVAYRTLVVLVAEEATGDWRVALAEGCRLPQLVTPDELPPPLARAADHGRPFTVPDLLATGDHGVASDSRSGCYTALRARGAVVGLLGIEHPDPGTYGPADVDLIANVAGPVALAVDNARWFARLRSFGAEAERARIARELHDRLAQSLAFVAFDLERIAADSPTVAPEVERLREVVRGMVGDLRETLFQLRSNVTEDEDLATVAGRYLERWGDRTGVAVDWSHGVEAALPAPVEQELWRILQEALVNVERHADARHVQVRWEVAAGLASLEVRDDGRGFRPHDARVDHYGLLGMHERAEAIGAHLTVDSEPGAGTRIVVELGAPG